MNRAIVVDANIAVKWVLPEASAEQAQALLEASLHARRPILSPPHLASEVTNAIYERLRRGEITESEAEEAVGRFLHFPIRSFAPADLYATALAFARAHGLTTTYESLYVVLAYQARGELWTDDRALLKTIGPAAPWVRWIGDFSPDRGSGSQEAPAGQPGDVQGR